VSEAAALLSRERPDGSTPVVADVGSGGGWAARLLEPADVIAFDLLDVSPGPGALTVRADMRRLPLRDSAIDAALYAASLHYAPVEDGVSEAARVLRPGGLMLAVDSPIYEDAGSQARAAARTAAYYAAAGYPELADRYHPINAVDLRAALVSSGFEVERLSMPGGALGRWSRMSRNGPSSLVVARRLR
jgi:SAM-dependent methyltransferase